MAPPCYYLLARLSDTAAHSINDSTGNARVHGRDLSRLAF